jgi:medium-chain acyl-[acyl-carrier-protein] hydrolase
MECSFHLPIIIVATTIKISDPHSKPPIHHLKKRAVLRELDRRYRGIIEEIFQDFDLVQELLPGLRASFEMYESYKYVNGDPLDCPMTAFGGLQDDITRQEDLEAWRKQTKRTFTLHMMAGNHFFIHLEREHFLRTLSNSVHFLKNQKRRALLCY